MVGDSSGCRQVGSRGKGESGRENEARDGIGSSGDGDGGDGGAGFAEDEIRAAERLGIPVREVRVVIQNGFLHSERKEAPILSVMDHRKIQQTDR